MTRHGGNVRNVEPHFKQTADALMPQVVKPQILDPKHVTNPREGRADRVSAVWEYSDILARHQVYDRSRFSMIRAIYDFAPLLRWRATIVPIEYHIAPLVILFVILGPEEKSMLLRVYQQAWR